ncbi:restriction endonuclease subunit S [Corynebacterium sanguinis]|nr:restriction endonuclease subunit S [Corynebacterium sanguinis]
MSRSMFPLVRLARVARRVPPIKSVSSCSIGLESVESWSGRLIEESLEPADSEGAEFEQGDILFGKLRPYLAKVWVADRPGTYIGDFIRLRPFRDCDPQFLGYVLRSREVIEAASAESLGTKMPRTEWERLRQLQVPAPPLEVQHQVVDYLDRETAEIDAFIADLLRARKLLGYRLKSIADEAIHAALPKVDQSRKGRYGTPDHPFGNDWIPLGALAAVGTGSLDTQDASENGIFPFFVRSDNIELSESATHHGEAVLTAGDGAGVGKVFHHYVGYFAAHQRVYVIEPGPKLEGRFLYWTLRTYFGDIVLAGTAKSTVESLRRPMLTGFPIPSLPLAEQRRIAEALDRANDEISEQLADAQKAIDLAQERRSALITVAVTGQIDVTKQGVSAAEQLRDELEVHV